MKSLFQFFFHIFLAVCLAGASDLSGIPCEQNEDCTLISGANCNLGEKLCECAGFQVLDPNMQKCLPVALGTGASCEEDVQCSTVLLNGGTCKSGKCGCADGMHYLRGRCWPSKSIGDACDSVEECTSVLEVNAVQCFENKCACADGFYMREYSDCRKKVENVGDQCALNSDCSFEGAFCNKEKVCECVSGRGKEQCTQKNSKKTAVVTIERKMKEVKQTGNKALSDACTQPEECGAQNSQCSPSGYCICKNGYFQPQGEQNCIPEIGGPCTKNEECVIGGSSCEGNMCVCGMGTGASASKQECLTQIVRYNNRCNETAQCTLFGARAQCIAQGSNNCKCDTKSRHLQEDNFCWIAKAPGDSCADMRDCSVAKGDDFVFCNEADQKCTCIDGFHTSADGKDCFLNAPNLNDVCVEDGDCEVDAAICDTKSKKCACKTGYYPKEGSCWIGVGGPCAKPEDCATAVDSVCSGDEGQKMCTCPTDYTANLQISACLPLSGGLNETCSENQQCTPSLGDLAECFEESCRCKKRHHLVSGKCTPSKGLGDDCNRGYECFPPVSSEGVICRNNKCSCDYGLVPAENNAYCTSSAARFALAHLALLCLLGLSLWL